MRDKKFAVLGDIHSNLEALTAVMEDASAQGVTDFVCVGDIVGYNANPCECLAKVREVCGTVICGNHDHYCSHDESLDDFHPLAAKVIDWTRKQLSDEETDYLLSLKLTANVAGFSMVHSTLDMPERWGYVFDSLEADAHFNYQRTTVCFYGHTHVPVVFEKQGRVVRKQYDRLPIALGKKFFINVGSVGQPRDGDPRSSYVIFDQTNREVVFRRLEYDLATTQKKIFDVGLPERLARRLEVGK